MLGESSTKLIAHTGTGCRFRWSSWRISHDCSGARRSKQRTVRGPCGRPAATRVKPRRYRLSVGNSEKQVENGCDRTLLPELSRVFTGHTPSRRHPQYWHGDIPSIGIRDATENHGRTIFDTHQHTN